LTTSLVNMKSESRLFPEGISLAMMAPYLIVEY